MNGKREDWKLRSVLSVGDGKRQEREAAACGLLLSWGGDWGIGFGREEGKSRSEDNLFAFLSSLAGGFPGNTRGSWRLRQRDSILGKAVGKDVPDSLEMGADSKGRLQQIVCYSV